MKVIPQPLSVEEYHSLIKCGILNEDDRCELLEGYLVPHVKRSPPHEYSRHVLARAFDEIIRDESWITRHRSGVTLFDSEPEPDLVLVRGHTRSYFDRHPGPGDFGIIIEVADVTIEFDRSTRRRIYAKAELPAYWIVNLVDRQVEVFEQPSGPTLDPSYSTSRVYHPGDSVPFILDGNAIGVIPVDDLLP